ncbi:MAG: hypothetical protein ACP5FK_10950 [bacterium]
MIRHNKYCLAEIVLFFLCMTLLSCGQRLTEGLAEIDPELVIHQGRLTELPASANEIRAAQWARVFSGESYLAFSADSEDIEMWLNKSTSVKSQNPVILDSACRYLPDDYGKINSSDLTYHVDEYVPDFYRPLILEQGRLYEIPPDSQGHYQGKVIIDDCNHRVYVNVLWS